MTTKRILILTGSAVLLAAAISPHVVPLYDGVGFPDEPYRYVGQTITQAPTGINQTIPVGDLNQYGAAASSQEVGPQISIYFQQQSVKLPDKASFTVTAAPTAPTLQPASGRVASNVYVVQTSSTSGTPRFDVGKSAVFLRLPGDKPTNKVALVYRASDSAQWQTQPTTKTGSDIYRASFQGSGQYALATGLDQPSPAALRTEAGRLQPFLRFLPWLLFGGVIAAAILVARYRKPKSQPPHHD